MMAVNLFGGRGEQLEVVLLVDRRVPQTHRQHLVDSFEAGKSYLQINWVSTNQLRHSEEHYSGLVAR